jgi:hypothetical protein
MLLIRKYEETMVDIYFEGKMPAFDIGSGPVPGEMHLAAGQVDERGAEEEHQVAAQHNGGDPEGENLEIGEGDE